MGHTRTFWFRGAGMTEDCMLDWSCPRQRVLPAESTFGRPTQTISESRAQTISTQLLGGSASSPAALGRCAGMPPRHVGLLLCTLATLLIGTGAVAPSTKHKEIDSTPELEALREQNRQLRFNHAPPSPSKNELKSIDFHFSRIDHRGRSKATPYRSSFPPPPPSEYAPLTSSQRALTAPIGQGSMTQSGEPVGPHTSGIYHSLTNNSTPVRVRVWVGEQATGRSLWLATAAHATYACLPRASYARTARPRAHGSHGTPSSFAQVRQ